jgi:hypothetical protein
MVVGCIYFAIDHHRCAEAIVFGVVVDFVSVAFSW